MIIGDCDKEDNRTNNSAAKFAPEFIYGRTSKIILHELVKNQDRIGAPANSHRSFERNKRKIDKDRRQTDFQDNYSYIEKGNRLNRAKLKRN